MRACAPSTVFVVVVDVVAVIVVAPAPALGVLDQQLRHPPSSIFYEQLEAHELHGDEHFMNE